MFIVLEKESSFKDLGNGMIRAMHSFTKDTHTLFDTKQEALAYIERYTCSDSSLGNALLSSRNTTYTLFNLGEEIKFGFKQTVKEEVTKVTTTIIEEL